MCVCVCTFNRFVSAMLCAVLVQHFLTFPTHNRHSWVSHLSSFVIKLCHRGIELTCSSLKYVYFPVLRPVVVHWGVQTDGLRSALWKAGHRAGSHRQNHLGHLDKVTHRTLQCSRFSKQMTAPFPPLPCVHGACMSSRVLGFPPGTQEEVQRLAL